jgi:hypothetical protein
MTREDFEDVVRRALAELRVADQVTLVAGTGAGAGAGAAATRGNDSESDAMTAELRLGAGSSGDAGGGGRTVSISVAASGDAARVASETRAELRRALRMCPLCERIGHVEKLRGETGQQEGCVVRCPACGDFEIDQELIRRFRSARERHDAAILDRLPSLSERTRTGPHVRITAGNWQDDHV